MTFSIVSFSQKNFVRNIHIEYSLKNLGKLFSVIALPFPFLSQDVTFYQILELTHFKIVLQYKVLSKNIIKLLLIDTFFVIHDQSS